MLYSDLLFERWVGRILTHRIRKYGEEEEEEDGLYRSHTGEITNLQNVQTQLYCATKPV